MPDGLVVLRRCITFAFLGDDMQHLGTAVVLDLVQYTDQSHYVMTVGRTEIADVQAGKDITALFGENSFQTVVATQHSASLALVHQMQLCRYLIEIPPPFVVCGAGGQIDKVLGKTAFERIDSHMVVVQDNQEVILIHRGVVQALESQTSRHGSVADDGNYIMSYRRSRSYSVCGLTVARLCPGSNSEAVCYIYA